MPRSVYTVKGTVSRDFLLLVIFTNQFPPSPRLSLNDCFDFFFENSRDIRKLRCTTGINNTSGKFATTDNDTSGKIAAGIVATGGKFATSFASVVDTGGKFATGVNNTGGKQWEQLLDCCQLKMNLKRITINVPVVYKGRDEMILMWATSISRAI
jgi:hypothetical protein